MTEDEWNRSENAGAMLNFLWRTQGVSPDNITFRCSNSVQESDASGGAGGELGLSLHRFYLASCRGIWALLPQEASRRGVEIAEQFLAGKATAEEVTKYNWHTEGAAFCIDYNTYPEEVDRWVAEVRALPPTELRSMLDPPEIADEIEPRELLKRAAYFADYSMIYPSLRPLGPPPESCWLFLSAKVLRQHINYPRTGNRVV